jgi:GTPase SAR1 family protein
MKEIQVCVIGEAGSGKSTVVKGLANAAGAAESVKLAASNNDEKGFWASQKEGETAKFTKESGGTAYSLNVKELIGSRSRRGNILLGMEFAKKANVIVFCMRDVTGANESLRFYGLNYACQQLASVNNKKAKVILALTCPKYNKDQLDFTNLKIPAKVTPIVVDKSMKSMQALLETIIKEHEFGTPMVDNNNNVKSATKPVIKKVQKAVAVEKQAPVVASVQTQGPVLRKRKMSDASLNSVKEDSKKEPAVTEGILTRTAKKMMLIPKILGFTAGAVTEGNEIPPLA